MKTKIVLSLVVLVLGVVAIKAQTVTTLQADDFEKKAALIKDKTILDVRTAEEYKEGHLANAHQVDFYQADFKTQISKLDKAKPIFVYCKGGVRSASSCEILKDLGFKEVYNLQGGIADWKKAGKRVVN